MALAADVISIQAVLDDVFVHAKEVGVDLQIDLAGGADSSRGGGPAAGNMEGSISEEAVAAVLVLGVIASTAVLGKGKKSASPSPPQSPPPEDLPPALALPDGILISPISTNVTPLSEVHPVGLSTYTFGEMQEVSTCRACTIVQ